jgi:hypothetical protein
MLEGNKALLEKAYRLGRKTIWSPCWKDTWSFKFKMRVGVLTEGFEEIGTMIASVQSSRIMPPF